MNTSDHKATQISPSGSWEQPRKRSLWTRKNKRKGTRARRLRAFWNICTRLFKTVSPILFVAFLFLSSQHTWHLLTTSSFFGLRTFHYEGNTALPKAALKKYLDLQDGDNLLAMNLRQMASQIKAHPRVKTVQIHRKFPNTLKVKVITHEPVAVLHLDQPYLMNKFGIPFARVHSKKETKGLLRIRGFEQYGREARDGRLQSVLQQVLRLNRRYKDMKLSGYKTLEEIEYNALLGYILHLGDARVRIGEDQFERRLDNLRRVYSIFQQKGVHHFQYIYLNSKRYPERVTFRLHDSVAVQRTSQ
jgi:cell division protein FtsQ